MTLSAAMDFFLTAFFRAAIIPGAAIWFLLTRTILPAQDFHRDSAGARFGFPVGARDQGFYQAEGFANLDLPWRWEFNSLWRLQSRLDLAGGGLRGHGDDAFVGSLGPALVLQYDLFPVSVVCGSSPTYISQHEFGPTDLGTLFQFSSHIGVDWDIGWHVQVGYRLQHMSNSGISHHNPGLNLHMFALSYRF